MARHSHGAHGNAGGWNGAAGNAPDSDKRAAPPKLCADCKQPMLLRRNGMGGKKRCDSCAYDRAQLKKRNHRARRACASRGA